LRVLIIITVVITGLILIYGTQDMPDWGDPNSPASTHVSPRYLKKTMDETATPNAVTSGETTVIFTAGVACILMLRVRKKRKKSD
jgi:multicomponent Na+:H+ antiporter subunit B